MLKRIPTRSMNWILMITLAILFFELMFFGGGLFFSALFLGFLTFLGWKNYRTFLGKLLFWIGIVSLALNILTMYSVRFLFIGLLVLFFREYRRSSHDPDYITPRMMKGDREKGEIVTSKPLFQHRFLGDQQTEDMPYQWRDINIHGGIGDRIIDLSNTVIQDDAIISIRHLFGNIKIYVPYEIEVSVHHSTMFGNVSIFHKINKKMLNETLIYETENFQQVKPGVKIVTSVFSGDVEVRRI
ncbi:cell wall-active antibiotics response protein [Salipaludibacillus agaradhaerens]|uniref:Cell wall-active antibiotics response protein n=1 Tax=Salipaludibacillus agaradhaerens TaxID=76935 RepID=A0A9Q4B098_SALAG|nr:cell wall-active antibiotics response protein LiaF [Salipaludibacillus agaradhaerens]MCR6095652.1 cell wall-active antibiotics response protein [Salipaludibacillus agaradhaerens]MCR6107457.1 cell wall-active antibiotics response protein [Salipaludibacillus agaradhaerens]MCR6114788.1 cell wall-active antibiotics response protein [Salipaludibacillus agaradhaerens]MCR6119486.1 cell wall-active antibiotics response protein [Salipaludibacillus agaradhaerens]